MKGLTRPGAVITGAIVVVFLVVAVIAIRLSDSTPVTLGISIAALWGLFAMELAAILTPFIQEIPGISGDPFLRVHHAFAAFGLAAITLHPGLIAERSWSLFVLIPTLPYPDRFAQNSGRIALLLIYLVVIGALVRMRFTEWRYVRLVIHLCLLLGLLNGSSLSRRSFGDGSLFLLYLWLGVAPVGAFALKRWQRRTMAPASPPPG